ncbi:MAG: type VI secretion system baseplate subunit TssE [Acidobacteria bacterium]|nr:type VI secretion system baseplate subunit TssE [Acidobacteriota bacterium]
MREKDVKITPSLIDRLIDLEPNMSSETAKSRSQSLKELKISVKRDIEWLLNTRHSKTDVPEGLEEVNRSLAVYGLADFTGQSSKDEGHRKDLIKNVENALRFFEPRLMNLKVTLEATDKVNRGVRFKIEGVLRVEPTPEPIVFDTVLQVGNGDFSLTEV